VKKIVIAFGTRPEAIKMAPIVRALRNASSGFEAVVLVTAQHRQMLDQVLDVLEIDADYDLDLMVANQTLAGFTSRSIVSLTDCIAAIDPDCVLVHGDTSTAFTAALAAFYNQVPVGHVEAGLRTGNLMSPWPEEANRKLIGALAQHHFAPTQRAAENLLREGVDSKNILVTGNTVVDSLLWVTDELLTRPSSLQAMNDRFDFLEAQRQLALITNHRRENFGDGMQAVLDGILQLTKDWPEVQFVFPTHLNPQARGPAEATLGSAKNVFLIEPVEYLEFVYLMKRSTLIITDSGGVQEEAPSLNIPVLVTRNETERPEAVEAGTATLVGTDRDLLVQEANRVLERAERAAGDQLVNPYGDGQAANRILAALQKTYGTL